MSVGGNGDRPAIWAEGLRKSFGDVVALGGVDLRVERATILAMLGPNGAGKTTTVRILTTLLEPDGGRPEVLFLDEPTTGLDPRGRLQLWELIRGLVSDGTTLLLTTQYMEEADQLADAITVVDLGKVIAEGTSDELKSRVGGDVVEFRVLEREALG